MPLLAASIASLTGHLELAPEFDWIGTTPALVGFAAAAGLEVGAYLVPLLDNVLDTLAAPAATVAGTVLTASTIVDLSPWLKWSLAIVAGGGIAGTIQLFTGATRLTSTALTGGLANPGVSSAEAGGAAGLSLVAVATPVAGLVLALLLVLVAVRALARRGGALLRPARKRGASRGGRPAAADVSRSARAGRGSRRRRRRRG